MLSDFYATAHTVSLDGSLVFTSLYPVRSLLVLDDLCSFCLNVTEFKCVKHEGMANTRRFLCIHFSPILKLRSTKRLPKLKLATSCSVD